MTTNNKDARIDFARDILEHNSALIRLIDTKAGMILGSAGIILGLLSFFAHGMVVGHAVYALCVTVGLLGITVFLSFMVILPRITPKAKGETAIFYESIIQQTEEEYYTMLEEMIPDKILADYARNIHSLALVQKRKFGFLRMSLVFMVLSVASPVVTLILYLIL